MKILDILIICPVLTLQAFASSGCKFWPYWNGCDPIVERSCCNVLESIFGGGCPQLCKGESCSGLSQKIRNWCDLTKNNTYMGMSCADETNKPNLTIIHSCCESNHSGNGYCKGETTNHCYGLFAADELEVTIHERKTCCSEGYSGRTCSGYFIEGKIAETSTSQTTKPTTTKPTTTTTTEEPTTTTTSSTGLVTTPDQTFQGTGVNTLVGAVVGGFLGGILAVLIVWSCRRRRQVAAVQREMTPMGDDGYINPCEEILEDSPVLEPIYSEADSPVLEPIYSEADSPVLEPRYNEARDFKNYLLAGGTSQTSRGTDGVDERAQSEGEDTLTKLSLLETPV